MKLDRTLLSGQECRLYSSHGVFVFDPRSGIVIACEHDDPGDIESYAKDPPALVNIGEWQAAYPTERLGDGEGGHDILDFGFWLESGAYEPPCLDWRKERELARKDLLT